MSLTGKLLHEVILDLQQPVQAVLALQVNMRTLKMVPKMISNTQEYGV